MEGQRLRALIVEDSEADARLVARELARGGFAVELRRVETAGELVGSLAEPWDVVLSDWSMPEFSGPEALAIVREKAPELPFIFVSGTVGEETAVAAMRAGAADFLVKDRLGRLVPAVEREVREALNRAGRREAERRLVMERAARERFERAAEILDTVGDAFVAVDEAWRVVYVNDLALLLFGRARAQVIDASLWESWPDLARSPFEPELRQAAAGRAPATVAHGLPGTDRWLEARAFPHDRGLTLYLRDVTERHRIDELRRSLLAVVGHDLRTPLTAVAIAAQALARDASLSAVQRRYVDRMLQSARRMERLIEDLFDYSAARYGGGIRLTPRATSLEAVCRDAISEVQAMAPGRRIESRADGDVRGVWDADRLTQAVGNLLANAARYGDAEAPIVIRWWIDGGDAVISVHNRGAPISPDVLPRIFEPFRRGENPGEKGLGLGLFIVRQIALAHSGSIAAESTDKDGTTFRMSLPI